MTANRLSACWISRRRAGLAVPFLAFSLFISVPIAHATEHESVEARLAEIEARLAASEAGNVQELFLKISRLEQALREITGLAEDAERTARQLNNRFEKFATDTQDRLDLIEEKLREGVAAVPVDNESGITAGSPDDAEALFDYALNQFLAKKDYQTAAQAFESFLDRFPEHPKADRIHYWLGELYFVQKDFKTAAEYYLDGWRSFGQGEKAMDNLFKLGQSLASMGQRDESCSVFDELSANFPNAPARITSIVERTRRQMSCV